MFRRFIVPSLWEIATTAAASFTGAWLWRIHTPLPTVILYYGLWFGMMTGIFGLGTVVRKAIADHVLQVIGLSMAIAYLATFSALGSASRFWVWILGVLTGLASGFYWLALYIRAARTVAKSERTAYTAWLGVVETASAVVVPPLAGVIVTFLPGILGYRLIFLVASLLVALALAITLQDGADAVSPKPPITKDIPHSSWATLLRNMAVLGLRDGIMFFVPGLYLFMKTGSPVLLGEFLGVQATVQSIAFWAYERWPWHPKWALAASLAGSAALLGWGPIPGVFALGVFSGAAYPAFKVPLESRALAVISEMGEGLTHTIRRTSQKELTLNGGRLAGFVALWLCTLIVRRPVFIVYDLLVVWPILAVVLMLGVITTKRQIMEEHSDR